MAKKTEKIEIPKFTVDKATGKRQPCAKIALPLSSTATAAETIKGLIEQAVEETEATELRGTLTLYKRDVD